MKEDDQKKEQKLLTVVTPTFNRAKELGALYESLRAQTFKDFCWIIIDDGSIDDTSEVVDSFKKDKNSFSIRYLKKKNGGKHTALNLAFKNVKTELLIIVDSDDYLVDEAVEIITEDWKKYGDERVCGLCYKRGRTDGSDLSDDFGKDVTIANYRDFIINSRRKKDKAEVFRSSVFLDYTFPEFEGEKFLGEGFLWCKISHEYDMVFVNKIIYICEYLDGGLTKSGRRIRIENPLGGMYYMSEFLNNRYRLRIRCEKALLYLTYARFAKKDVLGLFGKSDSKIILGINLLPSFILYKYWGRKYGASNG